MNSRKPHIYQNQCIIFHLIEVNFFTLPFTQFQLLWIMKIPWFFNNYLFFSHVRFVHDLFLRKYLLQYPEMHYYVMNIQNIQAYHHWCKNTHFNVWHLNNIIFYAEYFELPRFYYPGCLSYKLILDMLDNWDLGLCASGYGKGHSRIFLLMLDGSKYVWPCLKINRTQTDV